MGRKYFLIIILFIIGLSSCLKEEGEGGTSTILGKVFVKNYNAELIGEPRWEGYAPDEDVYIIYGTDSIYSDRFRTNYDGSFRFKYLRPGNYTIFVYSKSLANQNTNHTDLLVAKKIPVNIVVENQVVILDDIIIIK